MGLAAHTDHQGQKSRKRRKITVREDGRDNAQEACGETEEKGEEKQAVKVIDGN